MFNDYTLLKLGQVRAAELLKEAEAHRLARLVRKPHSARIQARVVAGLAAAVLGSAWLFLIR